MCAKSLATLATQPLIVSKALLQKKNSKTLENENLDDMNEQDNQEEIKFANFVDALGHLWQTEKLMGLSKGVAPQLLKGVMVQGMLFKFKDQIDMVVVHILQAFRKRRIRLDRRQGTSWSCWLESLFFSWPPIGYPVAW